MIRPIFIFSYMYVLLYSLICGKSIITRSKGTAAKIHHTNLFANCASSSHPLTHCPLSLQFFNYTVTTFPTMGSTKTHPTGWSWVSCSHCSQTTIRCGGWNLMVSFQILQFFNIVFKYISFFVLFKYLLSRHWNCQNSAHRLKFGFLPISSPCQVQ